MPQSTQNTEWQNGDLLGGKWLRKATAGETEMCNVYKTGHRLWYQLDLSALKPLQEEQVRIALVHLYRKTPNLPVCFGIRDGELWLKQATSSNIDFKVDEKNSLEDVRLSLHNYMYDDKKGPLICARLLKDISTEDEDLEPNYPHKYHMMFGIYHALVDGTSTMSIMGFFCSLLNDVITGIPVDDNTPFGTFVSDKETLKLMNEKSKVFETDPLLKKKICEEIQFKISHKPIILKMSPKVKGAKRTVNVISVLDQRCTRQFLKKCKQERVTVNAFISSCVNVALVETLIEEGIEQDSYLLQGFHAVNLRRYWPKNTHGTFGCHIGFPLIYNADTPRDVHKKFWPFAKQMDATLKEDIASGKILSLDACKLTLPNHGHAVCSDNASREYEGDYITSSLGDVTNAVTCGGDHVRITMVKRSTSVHGTELTLLFNYHTFRERFMFSMHYNSDILSLEVGKKIHSKVISLIKELSVEKCFGKVVEFVH